MKKKFLIMSLLVMMLMFTGCSSKDNKEEKLSCYRNVTVSSDVRMEVKYEVIHDGEYVKMVETEEKIISDDKNVLDSYKSSIEAIYEPYSNIDHYNNTLTIDGNTFTSITKIDYSKIDTDELIAIDSANATIIKDGKVLVSDVKKLYEQYGAICE